MPPTDPAFATDAATATYYDRRADEYDEWYVGTGLFAQRHRPGWHDELDALISVIAALAPRPTLDVACGTGFLGRHLPGLAFAVDRSARMVEVTRSRVGPIAAVADALRLPVADAALDRVFTGHFYGHLPPTERAEFLDEVWRVASELVVVDSALRDGVEPEQWQERVLNDGSRHRVFKRYLSASQLADEIGGEPLFAGHWFVAARATHGS